MPLLIMIVLHPCFRAKINPYFFGAAFVLLFKKKYA
jgi:hypothetical protein